MKTAFVTGSRGFIGRHLVERLQEAGITVCEYDKSIDPGMDIGDEAYLQDCIAKSRADVVYHLAANASVRSGWDNQYRDLHVNVIGTCNILRVVSCYPMTRLVFLSSSAVYGSGKSAPFTETDALQHQSSLYGASKLSAEAFIQAYCNGLGLAASVFRPVPLLGEYYHYGHVADFVNKLKTSPGITALGTGKELKTYLYAGDLVDAMMTVVEANKPGYGVYNVAGDESCTIAESIEIIGHEMGVTPNVTYTGSTWSGDNPSLRLDTTKIRALGWKPKVGLHEAYRRTVKWLL